jgi:hypothetical protein
VLLASCTPSEFIYDEKKQNYCEASQETLDVGSAAERRLVRKLDLRLLPCPALTYLLAFIDVRFISLWAIPLF